MNKEKDRLSVVMVNYNFGEVLIRSLKSLMELRGEIDLDIWVVDNASEDNGIKEAKRLFPTLHYIENKENIGFGAGNNKALRLIKNEYILILNPDTDIPGGTLSFMVKFMKDHPGTGAATCKAVRSDGKMDWAYHRGFPTPWASFLYFLGNDSLYHLTDRNMKEAHEVDAISGSFFLTRRSVLDKVGLFDEDYWMYAEDIDLCYRIKQAGFKVMFIPDVTITHLKGVSSGIKGHSQKITTATETSRKRAFDAFYETMKIFYRKHLAEHYPFFINWIVYLAVNLKWSLAKRKMHV